MKLEAGGLIDQTDIAAFVPEQKRLDGAPWLRDIASHVSQLSRDARELWSRLEPLLAKP